MLSSAAGVGITLTQVEQTLRVACAAITFVIGVITLISMLRGRGK